MRALLLSMAVCLCLPVVAWPAAAPAQHCAALQTDPNGTVRTTGFVVADAFGIVPDSSDGGRLTMSDNAPALRGAINCFNQVFIGSGDYNLNTTLVFADQFGPGSGISIGQMVRLRGVSHEKPPRTLLHSFNDSGAVIQLGSWAAKYSSGAAYYLERLAVAGQLTGVKVVATSSIHMHQVHISARKWAVEPSDIPSATALLISGCFWLWFEECVFSAAPPPGAWSKENLGTRPSVIMRGEHTPDASLATNNVGQVYLVRFTKAQFEYGAVRYEQNMAPFSGPPIGFWDFLTVSQEDSFTPLIEITGNGSQPLDKHSQPTAKFSQISVQGYMDADAGGTSKRPCLLRLSHDDLATLQLESNLKIEPES